MILMRFFSGLCNVYMRVINLFGLQIQNYYTLALTRPDAGNIPNAKTSFFRFNKGLYDTYTFPALLLSDTLGWGWSMNVCNQSGGR